METRKHSKTIGGSFKNEVCAKKRKIAPRSNLEWIWESFYGPLGVFFGPGGRSGSVFFEVEILCKKKVMRVELR